MKTLESYSDKEKCIIFDDLYYMALEHFNKTKKEGIDNTENDVHYLYEQVLGLLGEDIWEEFNTFIDGEEDAET